jgi:hypothetical protein
MSGYCTPTPPQNSLKSAAGAGAFDFGGLEFAVGLAEMLGDRRGRKRIDRGGTDDADVVAGGLSVGRASQRASRGHGEDDILFAHE